jgi:hypothetical protein
MSGSGSDPRPVQCRSAGAIAQGVQFGPKLTHHQRVEARKRLVAGESCRLIAKTYGVQHATIGRLGG